MALVGLTDVSLTWGGTALFERLNLQIEPGDRLCLVGRNGAGKSTLMRVLAGELPPDRGEVSRRSDLICSFLPQDLPQAIPGTALDAAFARVPGPRDPDRELRARQYFSKLDVDPEVPFLTLSGGSRRRALLAGVLAAEPDLVLLDEPTNHLDVETVEWLEDELPRRSGAMVFVTHDRRWARRMATRVAELDRGRLLAFSCGWDDFLERRDDVWEAEARREAELAKLLAREEEWVRRGVKARLKRNEGRVKALLALRQKWADRRQAPGRAQIEVTQAQRSGDLIASVEAVSFGYATPLVNEWSVRVMRGEKIGIVGRNGSGKTTLLRLLLGELAPLKGTVTHGTTLQIVVFDQLREQLNETLTVAEAVGGGSDTVDRGDRSIHLMAYLKRFLFAPERARVPVSVLSGGEKNRLLLAKIFTRPANVLVFDEPTNDLDAETLDLLEEVLAEFEGTVLLVSHDREFLDNVVTSTWWLPGDGRVVETVGGWTDLSERMARERKERVAAAPSRTEPPPARPAKRSFKQEKELEALPGLIESLEEEKAHLYDALANPASYQAGSEVATLTARLKTLDEELEAAYSRWAELES